MTVAERAELATLRERADMHDAKIAAIFEAMRLACEAAGIFVDDGEQPPPLELIPGGLDSRLDGVEKRVAVHSDVIEAAYAAEGLPLPAELGGPGYPPGRDGARPRQRLPGSALAGG